MVYLKFSSLKAYLPRIAALKVRALAQSDNEWAKTLQRAEETIAADIRSVSLPLNSLIQALKVNAAHRAARAQQARTD